MVKKNLSIILKILQPFSFFLCLQIVNVIIWSFLSFAEAYASSLLGRSLIGVTEGGNIRELLLIPVFFIAGIYLAWGISYRFHDLIWRAIQPDFRKRFITKMMQELIEKSMLFYTKNSIGSLSNKLHKVAEASIQLIETLTDSLFHAICIILIGLYVSSLKSYYLTCLLIGWLIAFFSLLILFYPSIRNANVALAHGRNRLMGEATDLMNNLFSIKLFNKEPYEVTRFSQIANLVAKKEKRRDIIEASLYFLQSICFAIFTLLGFLLLIHQREKNLCSNEDFFFYFTFTFTLALEVFPLSEDLQEAFDNLGYVKEGMRVIFKKRAYPLKTLPSVRSLTVAKGEISFNKVNFTYPGSKNQLFKELSLKIGAGSKVALVGYSGSGKSSLINLLLKLFYPNKGAIKIDGEDIAKISQQSLREAITLVTQENQLFSRTVAENIAYSLPQASLKQITLAAQQADAHNFIVALPKGYQTKIGASGMQLSGGQQQRINLARAFLKVQNSHAKILVLDEVTSQLDRVTEKYVASQLKKLYELKNQTVLMITHRLHEATIKHMDQIFVFKKGEVIQQGKHKELLQQQGAYNDFFTS